ncbi:MAG: hypothetical protein IKB02_00180 [Clostridia bacterium]|nr:hypothetical protein [Clostridia bacterium]
MNFDIYVLILCIFVFVSLVAVFSFMLTSMIKMQLRAIRLGIEDEQIKADAEKRKEKRSRWSIFFGSVLPAFFCILLVGLFVFSTIIAVTEDGRVGKLPVLKVVVSPSMSTISEKNTHLIRDNVTNQIDTFDLVVLKELPREEDLKVYDIVVYEVDGNMIIHRIVDIEEPNKSHPNERYFVLQGDANDLRDRFPVRYSQMKSIYSGIKIPFVGSFIYFMRTFAGGLCMLLTVFAMGVLPFIEKKLSKVSEERLAKILPKEETAETDE